MLSWLKAAPRERDDTCSDIPPGEPTGAVRREDYPDWDPPPARPVSAADQVPAIVEALQDEGLTGVVPRQDILDRYREHCWMLGFIPVSTNAFFEALKKVCKYVRPEVSKGRRVSHYVIPAKGVLLFPIGAVRTRNAAKPPKRARSGARRQANFPKFAESSVRGEPLRVAV
jgi:hypothetical protein